MKRAPLESALAELNFPLNVHSQLAALILKDEFAGVVEAETIKSLTQLMGISVHQLMLKLVPLSRAYAYPSISGFHVGAIVRGASGDLYFGANLEFPGPALSATVHAEQAAVVHALQQGERGITAVAVNESPCGHCRQFLTEINNPELVVITPQIDSRPICDLLPDAFTPSSLGNPTGLMDPIDHGLSTIQPSDSKQPNLSAQLATSDAQRVAAGEVAVDPDLASVALQMANRSYAPYTQSWAGIAVRTTGGQVIGAPYAENAAYNPSISPLQGVLVILRMQGLDWSSIEAAVLVEKEAASCSQEVATQSVLSTLGEIPLWIMKI